MKYSIRSILNNVRSILKNVQYKKYIQSFGAVLFWIVVWQLASSLINQEMFLTSPVLVIKQLIELSGTSEFWGSIFFSFSKIFSGFFIALFAAILLAVLANMVNIIEILIRPFMAVIKATPVASYVILCLFFISSENLSVIIAFLMVLPVIYTNVLQGINKTDPKLLEMAKVYQVGILKKVIFIYTPHVLPYFISACSISLGICWKSGIAAEVIGLPAGSIGRNLYQSKVFLDMKNLFAWTIVIILVSFVFEKIFMVVIRKIADALERA